ncbi:MAG: hypothetical protein HYR71_08050, partial [Chloroflexi bacterium]|nr:hypothetical protein [Chloroflexota bacterium]
MLPIARYRFHAVIVLTILAGIALSLVAQPPPATYAPGWSAPRALATVDLRDTRGISLSPDQSIHLVWSNTEDDALQVFSARMSLNGDWLARPQRISRAGTRSFSPALALLPDGGDLIAYIEKSPSAALMVSARGEPPRRAVDGVGDMRQLALAGNPQDTFAVWSEDRERQPAIYMARFNARGEVVSGARRLCAEAALATQPA